MRPTFHRRTLISRLRARIERRGYPRLQMLLIVALTGGAGFLATYMLLHQGVHSMAVRYPAAIGVAYLAFLFLLWLWLRTSASDYTDFPDLSWGSSPGGNEPAQAGGMNAVELASTGTEGGGGGSDALEAAGAGDEFAIALAIIAMVGAALLFSLWIVYSAPVLFAELLVDGVLSASLYRRLRGLETRHWLMTAIRRTIWPFVITAAIAGIGGMVLQANAPTALTLGDVLQDHSRIER